MWERHLPWVAPITALVLIALAAQWFDTTPSLAPPAEAESPPAKAPMSAVATAGRGDLEPSRPTADIRPRDEGKGRADNDDASVPNSGRAPADAVAQQKGLSAEDGSADHLDAVPSAAASRKLPDDVDALPPPGGAAATVAGPRESAVEIPRDQRRAPSGAIVESAVIRRAGSGPRWENQCTDAGGCACQRHRAGDLAVLVAGADRDRNHDPGGTRDKMRSPLPPCRPPAARRETMTSSSWRSTARARKSHLN